MTSFLIGAAAVVAILAALYWRWAQRVDAEIAEGADAEWARINAQEPSLVEGVSREKFGEVYRRVNFPRFPKYALAIIAAFVVSLPVTFAALGLSVWAGERLGIIPPPAELVRYVPIGDGAAEAASEKAIQCTAECRLALIESYAGFYYFFGVLAAWLIIVAVFMRRYHARRPGYLRDEILRAR